MSLSPDVPCEFQTTAQRDGVVALLANIAGFDATRMVYQNRTKGVIDPGPPALVPFSWVSPANAKQRVSHRVKCVRPLRFLESLYGTLSERDSSWALRGG